MSEHTKEPWVVEYMGSDESDVVGASGVSIICGSTGYMSDADARRIVACVNACAGIDTEELEIIADAGETFATVCGRHARQRDELLAALRDLLAPHEGECRFDHNGYCQEHFLDGTEDGGCRVANARALITRSEAVK